MNNADCIRGLDIKGLHELLSNAENGDIDYGITFCGDCKGEPERNTANFECEQCLMHWLESDAEDYAGLANVGGVNYIKGSEKVNRNECTDEIAVLRSLCYRAAVKIVELSKGRPLHPVYEELMAAAQERKYSSTVREIHIRRHMDSDSVKKVRSDLFLNYVEYAKKDMARELGGFMLENNIFEVNLSDTPYGKELKLSCMVVAPEKEKKE